MAKLTAEEIDAWRGGGPPGYLQYAGGLTCEKCGATVAKGGVARGLHEEWHESLGR